MGFGGTKYFCRFCSYTLNYVLFIFTFILGILCHEFLHILFKVFILAFFRVIGEPRTAVLHKGKKGFGFVLRGAKAASPLMDMVPSDKCPGLQYMDDVDPGGVADMAGIHKGDFLLEVRTDFTLGPPHQCCQKLAFFENHLSFGEFQDSFWPYFDHY